MERPHDYTMVRHDGQLGWKLPYPYKLLPSGGRVVVIDPSGITRLVSRKALTLQ
jgi:hypothetical protein